MTFGTQTFGTGTFGGGELTISSIVPAILGREGGQTLTLTGIFPTDTPYTVTVGGVAAFGGIAGQGGLITSPDGVSLLCVMPALPGQLGAVSVVVTAVIGGGSDNAPITVLERAFGSAPFEVRRMFPGWYAAGPRRLDLEPQEQ